MITIESANAEFGELSEIHFDQGGTASLLFTPGSGRSLRISGMPPAAATAFIPVNKLSKSWVIEADEVEQTADALKAQFRSLTIRW